MSDDTANVKSESSEPGLPPIPLKKKRNEVFWVKFWWIPLAFLVPFIAVYIYMGSYAHSNLAGSLRSGLIGLIVAGFIYGLWRVDQLINGPDTPVAGGAAGIGKDVSLSQKLAGPLTAMLGMMLWLGWMVTAHIMVIANDEANYVADIDEDGYTISRPSH